VLVNASGKLVSKNLNDLIEDAGRNGDVLLDPGDVFDNWNFDGGDIVVAELTFLGFSPG
jgi:hypothetical protein